MIKVLFTMTPPFNPDHGGVQRTTSKLSKKFTEMGYDVHIYSSSQNGHVEWPYATIHSACEPGGENNRMNMVLLTSIIDELRPDMVINQMPYVISFQDTLLEAKRVYGFFLIGCLRNSLFSVVRNLSQTMAEVLPSSLFIATNNVAGRYLYLQLHRLRNRGKLKRILDVHDRFVLLAPANLKELHFFVGNYSFDKVFWIPNSIPKIRYLQQPREKIILHVGRLNEIQKRSDLLVPFWKGIYERIPDWKFVIVGDGDYKSTLEEQIRDEGLDRIELHGFQEPDSYYKEASIFIMPSSFEGFPNTFIEAQSYGLPCIAFDSYPAINWIGNHDKDCFLVEAFDTVKMGEATVSLCNFTLKLKEMSSNAYINASRFTIEEVGELWRKFIEEELGLGA